MKKKALEENKKIMEQSVTAIFIGLLIIVGEFFYTETIRFWPFASVFIVGGILGLLFSAIERFKK
jgi:hypothetical protein